MRDGGKGDRQRPLGVDEETFANNWDQIFKKKELCSFCKKPYDNWGTHNCEEREQFRAQSEAQYQADRAKRMGGDDGWRGD